MNNNKYRLWSIAAALFVVLLGIAVVSGYRTLMASGITKGPDQQFGDQNLKTAVALIELHKVRTGRYPAALSELQFVGAWDGLALQSVSYNANAKRTGYYVEVQRGWVGKPKIEMPKEFWKGTGYDEKLRPSQ